MPELARIFSGDSKIKRVLLLLKFWYFSITRKTFLRGRQMRFDLMFLNKSFNLYIESMVDIAVLQEVFLLKEYEWELRISPKIIIDLGAHFGDTAIYYHLRYPEALIYAVEPAPETFKRLLENVKSIPSIIPIHAGIANLNGSAKLSIGKSSIGNSFSMRSNEEKMVSVPVYTLRTLLDIQGIKRADLIKFDIEGAEEFLFITDEARNLSEAYIGEVHSDLISIKPEIFLSKFKDFEISKEDLSNTQRFIIKAIKRNLPAQS